MKYVMFRHAWGHAEADSQERRAVIGPRGFRLVFPSPALQKRSQTLLLVVFDFHIFNANFGPPYTDAPFRNKYRNSGTLGAPVIGSGL